MRKKRIIASVFALLLIVGVVVLSHPIYWIYMIVSLTEVHTEVLSRSDSPTGSYVLRVISRDVNATTTESRTVYIGSDFTNGEPLFIVTRPFAIKVSWENDDTILISYDEDISPENIFTQMSVWNGINIKYQSTLETRSNAPIR